jgi:hypothetical protein
MLPAKRQNYNMLVDHVGGIVSEYSSVDGQMSSVVFRLSFEINFLKVGSRLTLGESEYRRFSNIEKTTGDFPMPVEPS